MENIMMAVKAYYWATGFTMIGALVWAFYGPYKSLRVYRLSTGQLIRALERRYALSADDEDYYSIRERRIIAEQLPKLQDMTRRELVRIYLSLMKREKNSPDYSKTSLSQPKGIFAKIRATHILFQQPQQTQQRDEYGWL